MAISTQPQPQSGTQNPQSPTGNGPASTGASSGAGTPANTLPGTPTPDTQVGTSTAGQPTTPDASGKATTGSESTGSFDWKGWADTVKPEDLLSHNRVAGIIGSAVQTMVQRQLEHKEAERKAQEKLEERRRLRREDPVRYAELDEAEEAAQAAVIDAQQSADRAIFAFQSSLPESVQAKLRGKTYPGTREQGLQAYMNEVSMLMADHLAEQKVHEFQERWETERKPALEKELLGQVNGNGAASPTVHSNGEAGSGAIDQSVFDENRGVPGWLRANKKAVHDAIAAGRITY